MAPAAELSARLLAAASLVLVAGRAAADDAAGWLGRMDQALRGLSYEGRLVYVHDGAVESLRLVHVRDGDRQHERLESLNGAARVVIRNQERVTCLLTESRAFSMKRDATRGPLALPEIDPAQLSVAYTPRVEGEGRIAGRSAKVVALVPKDSYRYGYRLFLDEQHALPLKADLLDESGNVLTQTMFVDLRVGPEVRDDGPADVASMAEAPDDATAGDASAQHGPSQWSLSSLPAGFRVATRGRRTVGPAQPMVEHLLLTDGVASISVFVSPTPQELDGPAALGAVNAYGRQVSGFHVTAMGEVPLRTLQMVVGGLRQPAESRP
jgi:sigma-E factor negative regulatory protein RseB